MQAAGLRTAKNVIATSVEDAIAHLDDVGLPAIIRPAFTLGGRGGGIARTREQYAEIVARGIAASPIGQVLIDESVLGWGEFELEVMRDRADNVVIVCSIENIDPMGVHTGDSVTVAPQQTLTDRLYQKLRDQAIAVIRAVGVETGGSNVQFAVNPVTEEIIVIEMNPRVSRSSALASKATGFPIAKIAARLAVGYTLDEIPNDITRRTPASFEPALDYVVVKWPRFAFEKFPGVDATLTTHMKSVGEVMAIGRTFRQAFAKAMRSRELDAPAAGRHADRGAARGDRDARRRPLRPDPRAARPRHRRRRRSAPAPASTPGTCASSRCSPTEGPDGGGHAAHVPRRRHLRRRVRGRDAVLLLGLGARRTAASHEVVRGDKPSVMILGSGPNRIGQGIEFDYCCVHAAMTVRESGRDAVMVNCNPETVSTDYDTSDRLYFEPLTLEDVLGDRRGRAARGRDRPVRRPDAAEARRRARARGRAAARHPARRDRPRGGPRPLRRAARASSASRRRRTRPRTRARRRWPPRRAVGFPLLVRPSYVLGGRAMEIVYSARRAARLPAPRALRRRAAALRPDAAPHGGTPGARDLPRPLPRERDRGRRRRDLRRRGRLDRRDHAARRGGRHPLGRLGVRAAAALARRRDARRDPAGHARHRARARHGRADQRPVRRARRGPLRDRGQPARVADRPVRLQGDRPAAGQARLPGDARREARRPRAAGRIRTPATCRSRRPCCRSTASRAPTRCSARRCARPAR